MKYKPTSEELMAATNRLIQGSFRRDGERLNEKDRPRFSIPASPMDDDLIVADAIACIGKSKTFAAPFKYPSWLGPAEGHAK